MYQLALDSMPDCFAMLAEIDSKFLPSHESSLLPVEPLTWNIVS